MSVATLHGIGPVNIGSTLIKGVTNHDTGVESQLIKEGSSGELAVRIIAIAGQKFPVGFTTTDLATALAQCGSLGCSLVTKPLTMYARKYAAGGSRDSTGHVSLLYQHGLLLPRTLSCQHQGDATLSYEGVVTFDGTHDPLVIDPSATIAAITADPRWTIDSVTLGGVVMTQVRSLRVDFGIQAASEGADSDVWDTHPSITAVEPVISVTSSKIGEVLDILGGSGAVSVVLRDRVDGGTFGTATLTLTGTGLALFKKPHGGGGNRPGESTVEAHLKYDGITDPIVITAA